MLRSLVALALASACAPRPTTPSTTTPIAGSPVAGTPIVPTEPPPPEAVDPLTELTIVTRPDWMDRFAADNVGDMRFFDVSALMKRHQLTRDRAVELQNHFRDLSRAQPGGDVAKLFEQALARASKGEFEDRRAVDKLRDAAFVVAFDLDDTLYDQSYDPAVAERCSDFEVTFDGKSKRIKLAPGAAVLIDRVAALGGAVVIFSAAPDDPTLANLRAWSFGGKPLPEHPAIAGVLTNSHLVLQTKHEGAGAEQPRRGRPVLEPSKDLRVFDETLTRAILVDDNPLRTFQPANLRLVKKFDAQLYCTTTDAKLRKGFDRALTTVGQEIEESVRYMKSAKVPFATAFLPYTQSGILAVELLRGAGMSPRAAIAWLREHPETADREF
jgi:NLI interacting factor-like phosphatase